MKKHIEDDDFIITSGKGESARHSAERPFEQQEAVIDLWEGRRGEEPSRRRDFMPHNLPVDKDTEFEIDLSGRAIERKASALKQNQNNRDDDPVIDEWGNSGEESDEDQYEGQSGQDWDEEYEDDGPPWDEDEDSDTTAGEESNEEDEYYDTGESANVDKGRGTGKRQSIGMDGGESARDGEGASIDSVRQDTDNNKSNRKDKKGRRRWRLFGGDHVLWIIIIALLIFSIFVTYSAQVYKVASPTGTLVQQLIFIVVGIGALWLVHIIKYQFYRRVAKLVWWAGIALTVAALLYGKSIGASSTRDLVLFGISFQPLEILKTGMVMLLAMQLAGRQKNIDRIKLLPSLRPAEWKRNAQENIDILTRQTIPMLGPIALTCVLAFFAVGNSTTLIIGATCFVMLFIGRVRSQDLWKIIGIGAFFGVILLLSGLGRSDTGQSRLAKFSPDMYNKHSRVVEVADLDGGRDSLEVYSPPVNAYDENGDPVTESEQAVMAKMAIASGEVVGKGPGMSTLRSKLPEAEKDYAYAFLVEEYGFVGGLLILLLYLWLFFRTIQIFKQCGTAFPSLLILGLGVMITVQAIMHMMVTVGLFPVAGQQLPLISKGGSSLVFTLFALGMILGVSRQTADNTLDRPKGESLT